MPDIPTTNGIVTMPWQQLTLRVHQITTCKRGVTMFGEDDRLFLTLALGGEVGELLNLYKKTMRGDAGDRRPQLAEEAADILIYLWLLSASYGIDLEAELQSSIADFGGHAEIPPARICIKLYRSVADLAGAVENPSQPRQMTQVKWSCAIVYAHLLNFCRALELDLYAAIDAKATAVANHWGISAGELRRKFLQILLTAASDINRVRFQPSAAEADINLEKLGILLTEAASGNLPAREAATLLSSLAAKCRSPAAAGAELNRLARLANTPLQALSQEEMGELSRFCLQAHERGCAEAYALAETYLAA